MKTKRYSSYAVWVAHEFVRACAAGLQRLYTGTQSNI